jgi:hypothetical protein
MKLLGLLIGNVNQILRDIRVTWDSHKQRKSVRRPNIPNYCLQEKDKFCKKLYELAAEADKDSKPLQICGTLGGK